MKPGKGIKRILGILTAVLLLCGNVGWTLAAPLTETAEQKENQVETELDHKDEIQAAAEERETEPTELGYMPGELLVAYKEGASAQEVSQSVDEKGGAVLQELGEVDGNPVAVVEISDEVTVETAVEQYLQDPAVEYAEPNYIFESFDVESNALGEDDVDQWYLDDVQAQTAWDFLEDYSGEKIRVAVLDTGARMDHEDLAASLNRELCKEVVKSGSSPQYTYTEIPLRGDGYLNGTDTQNASTTHGTHVSGILAAQSGNGVGIKGVASGGDTDNKNQLVELVVVDVFTAQNKTGKDVGTIGDVLEGMRYAQSQGCRVINLSLGTYDQSQTLENFCAELKEDGIVLVCAAGNDNTDEANYPGDYDSVISVISVNRQNEKSAKSNYGSAKDLCAPGESIYSTKSSSSSSYGYLSGTSMAAPIVSGVAAMILYVNPELTVEEVGDILCTTATDLGTAGKDEATGYGLVNARAAVEKAAEADVVMRAHVQGIGWQQWVGSQETAGSIGQGKRLEALELQLKNSAYTGSIEYETHVQEIGWQQTVKDGETNGTVGESKRLEAVRIRLSGDISKYYDIYYRVHCQSYGWLGWAKNGAPAGTAQLSKRMEAFEVRLVAKGAAAPGSEENSFVHPLVKYQTHVQTYGWQGAVTDGDSSGTSGESKRLEGIRISLPEQDYEGSIRYRTHVQTYGWQDFVSDGEMSGTSGESKRLEAIEIELTGEMAAHYDVYYRVHCQSYGWLGWAKNGEKAGTAGMSKRLEAIEICLREKGTAGFDSTKQAFIQSGE